jgi:hypothetical protein
MGVLRQAGGGSQGLHLSEIRSAHNGLAGLWAALCVSQLSLISYRKMWRTAPTLYRFSLGLATLKTIFLLLHSVCIIMLSESPLLRNPSPADLPPSCESYPAATIYWSTEVVSGKCFFKWINRMYQMHMVFPNVSPLLWKWPSPWRHFLLAPGCLS